EPVLAHGIDGTFEVLARRAAPLHAVHPGKRKAKRVENAVEVVDATPGHDRKRTSCRYIRGFEGAEGTRVKRRGVGIADDGRERPVQIEKNRRLRQDGGGSRNGV